MHAAEVNNLSRSDGSALVSTGETAVQASVYGPTEIKISKELYDKALIEVTFNTKVFSSDIDARFMEYFIRNAIESAIVTSMHPHTSINVTVQEITDAGNLLACSVNGACLALLDAGIPMNSMVAAISIALVNDKLIPFPSLKEIKASSKMTTICFESSMKKIVGMKNSSFLNTKELKRNY